jgi:hypothetical protein
MTTNANSVELVCHYSDEHTLFIRYQSGRFVASVEPEYRPNGTQTWDGMFPRQYKSAGSAKAAVGRLLLVSGLVWVPIEQSNSGSQQGDGNA